MERKRAMKTWTRQEGMPGSPIGYRREDGWHLCYNGRSAPHGWVVFGGAGLLPPRQARNAELGAGEVAGAQDWADGTIAFGQAWADRAMDLETERVARIM